MPQVPFCPCRPLAPFLPALLLMCLTEPSRQGEPLCHFSWAHGKFLGQQLAPLPRLLLQVPFGCVQGEGVQQQEVCLCGRSGTAVFCTHKVCYRAFWWRRTGWGTWINRNEFKIFVCHERDNTTQRSIGKTKFYFYRRVCHRQIVQLASTLGRKSTQVLSLIQVCPCPD
jgi:hypothetical protein